MVAALFISLLILLVLGVPVFVSLGLSSLIAVAGFSDFPLMIIVQRMIGGVDKFSLMAIPFFILAANVMKPVVSPAEFWTGQAAWLDTSAAAWLSPRKLPVCSSVRSPARLRQRYLRLVV